MQNRPNSTRFDKFRSPNRKNSRFRDISIKETATRTEIQFTFSRHHSNSYSDKNTQLDLQVFISFHIYTFHKGFKTIICNYHLTFKTEIICKNHLNKFSIVNKSYRQIRAIENYHLKPSKNKCLIFYTSSKPGKINSPREKRPGNLKTKDKLKCNEGILLNLEKQYTLYTKTKLYFNSSKTINTADYLYRFKTYSNRFRFKNPIEIRNINIICKIFGKHAKAYKHFNAKYNFLKGIKLYELKVNTMTLFNGKCNTRS